jgi:hypothetical protein
MQEDGGLPIPTLAMRTSARPKKGQGQARKPIEPYLVFLLSRPAHHATPLSSHNIFGGKMAFSTSIQNGEKLTITKPKST